MITHIYLGVRSGQEEKGDDYGKGWTGWKWVGSTDNVAP